MKNGTLGGGQELGTVVGWFGEIFGRDRVVLVDFEGVKKKAGMTMTQVFFFFFIYTHLFIYSFIHLFIYSFIHLFIYSFIHLFIYSKKKRPFSKLPESNSTPSPQKEES